MAWVTPAASFLGVVAAICFTASRQMRSAEGIEEVRRLGADLSEVASRAVSGILSPQQAKAIESRRDEMEQRYADAGKPAILQAQLVEAATAAGLVVREILPIPGAAPIAVGPNSPKPEPSYPAYRVSLEGSYQQIATYMENCKHQRLPARVMSLHMEPAKDPESVSKNLLWAEISLEIFQPREAVKGGMAQNSEGKP